MSVPQKLTLHNTAWKTISSFSKHSKKIVLPKRLHWNMIFLVLSGKMVFLFWKNILFFRRKMKDDLSQKIHGKIYLVKMVFYYYFVKKTEMIFSRKETLKDNIFGIIEKHDIHPRKYGISSNRKIKDEKKVFFYNDKKVCFCKKVTLILCTFMETFISVL